MNTTNDTLDAGAELAALSVGDDFYISPEQSTDARVKFLNHLIDRHRSMPKRLRSSVASLSLAGPAGQRKRRAIERADALDRKAEAYGHDLADLLMEDSGSGD